MKLTCPACNETLSLAALIEYDAAREAIGTALKMPAPLGKYLLQYLGFFKPAKSALSLDKVAKILAELLPMVTAGKVSKNGTTYAAPQEYWVQAIETMLANRAALTLPLKSHGYLISIIAGQAEKIEAKAEKQAEQGRQYGMPKAVGTLHANVVLTKDKTVIAPATLSTEGFRAPMPAAVQAEIKKFVNKAKIR